MSVSPWLSIVIPAFDEERRLGDSLERILAFLDGQSYEAEVLVVDNGSRDGTLALAERHAEHEPRIRALHLDRRGKGLAVRHGMLEAKGAYRFLCDADLSMPIESLRDFLPPALEDADVAVGSREAPGARRFEEPTYRHWVGRAYNALVRAVLLPGLQDSQCGFKCFRGEVAEDVFRRQRLDGLAFDAEALYIARRRGWRVAEVPIPWRFDADSRVRVLRDSVRMALDLWAVRRNARRGLYDEPC